MKRNDFFWQKAVVVLAYAVFFTAIAGLALALVVDFHPETKTAQLEERVVEDDENILNVDNILTKDAAELGRLQFELENMPEDELHFQHEVRRAVLGVTEKELINGSGVERIEFLLQENMPELGRVKMK